MPKLDREKGKALGYSDEEMDNFERSLAHTADETHPNNFVSQAGSEYDPSLGGGTLRPFGMDTGIPTPQPVDRLLAGTGRGLVHTGRSAANLVGDVSDQSMADEKAIDAPLLATGMGEVGNLLGEGAATAPIGFGVGGTLARFAGPVGRNAAVNMGVQGATQGLLTSDPGERGLNTALGGATGALSPLLPATVKRLVYGLKRTPAAQTLLDAGVDLTPGLMNPSGTYNLLEQGAEDTSFLREMFHPPRLGANQDWQRGAFEKAAVPGTKISADTLPEMLKQAQASYDPLYDQAKGFPVGPHIFGNTNVPLQDRFLAAANLPGAPSGTRKQTTDWLQDQLKSTIAKARADGGMDSSHLLQLRSDIRTMARDAAMGSDPGSRAEKRIYRRADDAVTEALDSQLPKPAMDALRYADSSYGKYKVLEDAIASTKDQLAGLTPSKLSQAIYNASADPAYAKNQIGNLVDLRDWAQAGHQVFEQVPKTGARAVMVAPAAMLGLHNPALGVAGVTGAVAGSTTATGRRLAQGKASPQRLAQALIESATPDSEVGRGTIGALGQVAGRAGIGAVAPHLPTAAMAAIPWLQALRGSSGDSNAPQSTTVR